jgi:hypothetical protein
VSYLEDDDLDPCERKALLVWLLAKGRGFTSREAAKLLNTTRRSAWRYLTAISRVVPIFWDDTEQPPVWRAVNGLSEARKEGYR